MNPPATTVTIAIDLLQLIAAVCALLTGVLGAVYVFGRLLMQQMGLRLDERFNARDESLDAIKRQIDKVEAHGRAVESHGRSIEADYLRLRAELPNEYVRREDWIRFSGTIDTKLDWLREKCESTALAVAQLVKRTKLGSDDGG